MDLIDLIVCDDIRFELSNKISLIGIYNDLIFHGELPNTIKIAFYLRFRINNDEKFPDQFKIDFFLNNKIIISLDAKIENDNNSKHLILPIINNSFPIPSIGEMTMKMYFFNNKKIIYEIMPLHSLKIISNT